MPSHPPGIRKLFGHDDDLEVGLGSLWHVVIVAFVDDLEVQWIECVQLVLNFLLDVHIRDSVRRSLVFLATRASILPRIASVQHPH